MFIFGQKIQHGRDGNFTWMNVFVSSLLIGPNIQIQYSDPVKHMMVNRRSWLAGGEKVSREARGRERLEECNRERERIAPSKSYKAMNNLPPPPANPDLFVRWLRRPRLYWNEGFLCPNLAFAAVSQSERDAAVLHGSQTQNAWP